MTKYITRRKAKKNQPEKKEIVLSDEEDIEFKHEMIELDAYKKAEKEFQEEIDELGHMFDCEQETVKQLEIEVDDRDETIDALTGVMEFDADEREKLESNLSLVQSRHQSLNERYDESDERIKKMEDIIEAEKKKSKEFYNLPFRLKLKIVLDLLFKKPKKEDDE